MDYDTDKIDEAVLALAFLTLHDGSRVWKSFDWDALNRLHDKGYISDPVSQAKSVVLTDEGLREAKRLSEALFAKKPKG
jgi:hypothetical protein